MLIEIAVEIEMFGEARIVQHAPGIAAYMEVFACFNEMMLVQYKRMRVVRNGAAVHYRLPVILA